jgi:SNF2-related domain/Helicase conserved C-terminal domain
MSTSTGPQTKTPAGAAPDPGRAMLSALAIAAAPMNRTTWCELLGLAGVRKGSRAVSTQDLRARSAAWQDAGALIERTREEFELTPPMRHELLVGLQQAKQLDRWYAAYARVVSPQGYSTYGVPELHLAAARVHLYGGRHDELRRSLEAFRVAVRYSYRHELPALIELLGRDPVFEAADLLPDDLCEQYLEELSERTLSALEPVPRAMFRLGARESLKASVLAQVVACAALAAEPTCVAQLWPRLAAGSPEADAARALVELTRGNIPAARALAQRAYESAPSSQRGRAQWLSLATTPWLGLLLVSSPDPHQVQLALSVIRLAQQARAKLRFEFAYQLLDSFRRHVDAALPFQVHPSLFSSWGTTSPAQAWLERLFAFIALGWTSPSGERPPHTTLQSLPEYALSSGFAWLGAELRALEAGDAAGSRLQQLYESRPAWEGTLAVLEHLLDIQSPAATGHALDAASQRLVWEIDVTPGASEPISARLQARTESGWSRGKRQPLRKLAEARDAAADWLDAEDRAVLRHLNRARERGFEQFFFPARAYSSLCGHPRVWLASRPGSFVKLTKRRPRLLVERDVASGVLEVKLIPEACASTPIVVERESDDEVVVYELDAQLEDVARTLARGMRIPDAGEPRLAQLIARLGSKFDVSSDIAGTGLVTVPADARIHVRLWRASAGIRGRRVVHPLQGAPRWQVPGQGQATLVAELEGQSRQTHRDLDAETRREQALLAACPTLSLAEQEGDDFVIRELGAALEALLELRALGDEVVVTWPEGSPLGVNAERRARDVRLSVGSARDLLTLDGAVEISQDLSLAISELLAAAERAHGRFIPLGADQFVALEEGLLRRLQQLAAVSHTKGGRVELSPALAALMDDWVEGSDSVKVSKSAASILARVREAKTLEPELPATLQAQLRPYQRAGFEWLSRLAHWGAGACLSDDMGLGKTLQVLALLLARASLGPALVVAPTSVCQGWQLEAERFAPRLVVKRFRAAERSADRAALLDTLGPHDLLLVSYGVMQNEIDALEGIEFSSVVLDEAQAIKNASAQRTRAALRLRGSFRIATSGTPIENHLGELWSILSFTNPGLLGTAKRFEERFARPIAAGADRRAADVLRRLISPFLLRRTKGEVLSELPAKTEITLHVELGADERAVYETIRQKALQQLDDGAPAGQQRFRILAELMRLRRAACHPDLVLPGSGLASAKLAAFQALTEELREGGHRALVFSQFVDHLEVVRAWLDEAEIPYQYLVGATPERERARAIAAFQHGQGDLFLISLKAGGFGLNLTQADYVVILDPWWNPAAEDQAADRAHRIGQLRPVTVYRLVAKDTVEERIIAMHRHKRNLADSLLDGMTDAAPVDLDALRGLLLDGTHAENS